MLLQIYQLFSVEHSSTLNMEAVGSCEKLVNAHPLRVRTSEHSLRRIYLSNSLVVTLFWV
jgi:hypothetical protein